MHSSWIEWANLIFALVIAGPVVAMVTQLFVRERWNGKVKWCVAVVLAAIWGVAQTWIAGPDILNLIHNWGTLTLNNIMPVILIVYASATGFYHRLLQGSVLGNKLLNTPQG